MTKEYTIESDWTTKAGLRAVVLRAEVGHRCGYVGITTEHNLYGVNHSEIESDIDVHGGVTYSGDDASYPVESNLHWFGFDTAHAGDDPAIGGQPLGYCVEQCEILATQLKRLGDNKKRHKHADVIHAWAEGAIIQYSLNSIEWRDCFANQPLWESHRFYRIKPAKKVIKFRNWLMKSGDIVTHQEDRTPDPTQSKNFVGWIGEWQEVEIEE